MFSLLALAGDIGCLSGPTLVGFISNVFDENLRAGFLTATLFPVILVVLLAFILRSNKKDDEDATKEGKNSV